MSSIQRTEEIVRQFCEEQQHWAERTGVFQSPTTIERAYRTQAMVGAITDGEAPGGERLPADLRRFARHCRDEFRSNIGRNQYRFATAPGTGGMYQDYRGQLCLHFQHYLAVDPEKAYFGAQLTGDCVSWAKRSSRDAARCYDIGHLREAEEYVLRSATADLYSMRGHTGAGASPSRIAQAATKIGILLEDVITSPDGEEWDFRDYKSYYKIGVNHGRTGLPRWIFDANREYGPKQVAEINSEEELLTALWNGCGVSVGSNIGVSKRGGKDGCPFLSPLQGSWPHDMHLVGFDDTREHHSETLVLWDQSWGQWNDIPRDAWPKEYGRVLPEGLFCLTLNDTMRAVRGGECHALSDSHGFRPRRQATLGAEGLI